LRAHESRKRGGSKQGKEGQESLGDRFSHEEVVADSRWENISNEICCGATDQQTHAQWGCDLGSKTKLLLEG